jgi:hypothetical protein
VGRTSSKRVCHCYLLLTKKSCEQCLKICIIILHAAQAAFVRALALYKPADPQHTCVTTPRLIYAVTSAAAAAAVVVGTGRIARI